MEAAIAGDPLHYTLFNPAQLRCIEAFHSNPRMVIVPMPNGIGKTYVLAAIMSGIIWPSQNALFNRPLFTQWPYRKQLRFASTAKAVEDDEAFQVAVKELWPSGCYRMVRGSGKGFYSRIETSTGFNVDILTYNQTPIEHASGTKGAVFLSEPPPKKILSENLARLRAGGICYLEMTPLSYAAYVKDEYIDKGGLFDDDGNQVGRIEVVTGQIEENCRDHAEGGQLGHMDIQQTIASYPLEEREARKTGEFMHMAGLIYQQYGDANEIDVFSEYHQEMWDAGKYNLVHCADPHDRKPFALGWYAVFPNDDVICIAEYPEVFFHEVTQWRDQVEDYRKVIIATEKDIGKPADKRFIDPNFGNAPKLGGDTVKQLFARACPDCSKKGNAAKCSHRIVYSNPPDSIADGHLIVRRAIGIPAEDMRPKFYVMKHCRNHVYAFRHYGYKESKNADVRGISQDPMLVHKDFPDLVRYMYLAGYGRFHGDPGRAPRPRLKMSRKKIVHPRPV